MNREDHRLETPDGLSLAVYTWTPERPRGLVQIVHGLAEHAQRYDWAARRMADEGWAVVAHDQRGHGQTARSDEELGHYADEGGWAKVIEDVRRVRAFARERVPDGPIVLLGHSGGSFVSLSEQVEAPGTVDALVLSGSNRMGGALVRAGRWVARLEKLRQGPRGKSALVAHLSFGSFNRDFEPVRTEFDWLSRDAEQVDRYAADPRCGFRCSNQLWIDLLSTLIDLGRSSRLARLPDELPIYLVAGDRDPVSSGGVGVRFLSEQLEGAGVRNLTTEIYSGARHEVFNEDNRDVVVAEMIRWMDQYARGV
ncbi:MAG TPA: alpha/beta hydrolase [Sandaracinaceae bacterium LLY-WYZ-13_1]|nr:alpha/beta hydrolase [Sandaracinaceae bacterium LLY-WYZ-13_1]